MATGGWQGTSCPRCGGPLRWAPEHGQWFCDRDQLWVNPQLLQQQQPPPPQGGYGHHGYPPQHGYGPSAPAEGRGRVWILVVVLALAATLVTVFLVMREGDEPVGAESPEELARRTMKAIEDEDPRALVRLSGSRELLESISDCPTDVFDEAELMWMRKIRRTRKDGLAVEEVTVGDKAFEFDEGDEMGPDCHAQRGFAVHEIELELASDDDDDAILFAAEIDGRWYLSMIEGLPDHDLTDEEREEEEEYERAYREKRRAEKREKLAEQREGLDVPDSVGADSATAVVDELFRSFLEQDLARLRKLLPEDDTLALVLDCDSDSSLRRDLDEARSDLERDMGNAGDMGDITLHGTKLVEEELYGPGERFDGCKVTGPITAGEVEARFGPSGASPDELIDIPMDVLEIGGRWFLRSFEP